ncbi:MAG: tetratricopeptide repeat protein, partial [Chitinivibrionales bacterium]|nr:tetratricopeptide repeat protein [Chitinivibrionales bacterium]
MRVGNFLHVPPGKLSRFILLLLTLFISQSPIKGQTLSEVPVGQNDADRVSNNADIIGDAKKAFRAADFAGAAELFKQAADLGQNRHVAYYYLAMICEKQGRLDQALDYVGKSIRIGGALMEHCLYLKGVYLFSLKKTKEADKIFTRILSEYPESRYTQSCNEFLASIRGNAPSIKPIPDYFPSLQYRLGGNLEQTTNLALPAEQQAAWNSGDTGRGIMEGKGDASLNVFWKLKLKDHTFYPALSVSGTTLTATQSRNFLFGIGSLTYVYQPSARLSFTSRIRGDDIIYGSTFSETGGRLELAGEVFPLAFLRFNGELSGFIVHHPENWNYLDGPGLGGTFGGSIYLFKKKVRAGHF